MAAPLGYISAPTLHRQVFPDSALLRSKRANAKFYPCLPHTATSLGPRLPEMSGFDSARAVSGGGGSLALPPAPAPCPGGVSQDRVFPGGEGCSFLTYICREEFLRVGSVPASLRGTSVETEGDEAASQPFPVPISRMGLSSPELLRHHCHPRLGSPPKPSHQGPSSSLGP